MKPIEQIKKELKEILSEKRYKHSLGVMEKAVELAKIYGEDEQKAAYTALVHDIAKEMSIEEYYEYAKENNIELSPNDKMCPSVIHGIIGANIAKRKYGFDKEMCDAIYYHTTGRVNMTMLDKIVYVADKIEDTRDYEEVKNLRQAFKNSNSIEEFILYDIEYYTIPKMIEKRKIIHQNSISARNDIILKLQQK